MRLHELYFLILVCGSFGVLALALAVNTIRYHRWVRETTTAAVAVETRAKVHAGS